MVEDYITKLITDCLDDCASMTNKNSQLKHIKKAIAEVSSRLHEPLQLAIVGRISSSKSTLVNAILGKAEVVRTGHEAETFNVSWLKYGNDDEPVKVFFKDGTHIEVPRTSWASWASHSGEERLKTNVSYIEVMASDEILKTVNIIDTPGLDATSRIDSENTRKFLKQVNPDAVVLLFTKSLSDSSLQLIDDFQRSDVTHSFSINPMNALGILSKPDLNWNVLNNIDVIAASKNAISRTLSNRDEVKKALFRILPVSALIGLASFDITKEEFTAFKTISDIQSKTDLVKLFMSVDAFVASETPNGVSVECKKNMILKYGLYGIHLCSDLIRKSPDTTVQQMAEYLRRNSGFTEFLDILQTHFGDRARVIKAQRSIVALLDACNQDSQKADSQTVDIVIENVRRRIVSIQDDLHDLKEIALLNSIYEGKMTMEESFINELKSVCGENGDGATNLLGVSDLTTVNKMIAVAHERHLTWMRKYNVYRRISAQKAQCYATLAKSYDLIAKRLTEQQCEYDDAMRKLSLFNRYVYGRTNV